MKLHRFITVHHNLLKGLPISNLDCAVSARAPLCPKEKLYLLSDLICHPFNFLNQLSVMGSAMIDGFPGNGTVHCIITSWTGCSISWGSRSLNFPIMWHSITCHLFPLSSQFILTPMLLTYQSTVCGSRSLLDNLLSKVHDLKLIWIKFTTVHDTWLKNMVRVCQLEVLCKCNGLSETPLSFTHRWWFRNVLNICWRWLLHYFLIAMSQWVNESMRYSMSLKAPLPKFSFVL